MKAKTRRIARSLGYEVAISSGWAGFFVRIMVVTDTDRKEA